jgi:hypothetical protein
VHGFDETWRLGVIVQQLTQLPDELLDLSFLDPRVGPGGAQNLRFGDDSVALFYQDPKDPKRLARQVYRIIPPPQTLVVGV